MMLPWRWISRVFINRKLFLGLTLFTIMCIIAVEVGSQMERRLYEDPTELNEENVKEIDVHTTNGRDSEKIPTDGWSQSKVLGLLRNIQHRLSQLENALGLNPDRNTIEDEKSCGLTRDEKRLYPHCVGKMEFLKQSWSLDPCYAFYGVDGSNCSIIMYLSEFEDWCPKKNWSEIIKLKLRRKLNFYAGVKTDLMPLLTLLENPNARQSFSWVRLRIQRMWSKWTSAVQKFEKKMSFHERKKKKILLHIGVMTSASETQFVEFQFKGGPLGEFVQWSDLISTLYLLGHDLTITSELEQLSEILSHKPSRDSLCQHRKEVPFDIIYTDILGLKQIKKKIEENFRKITCIIRVVDTFGTEPGYNSHRFAKSRGLITSYGGWDLNPRQFFTMFPHTPDNSFMGFVVEQYLNTSKRIEKRNQALVYGKQQYMWEGKEKYLSIINEKLEIHGTLSKVGFDPTRVPSFVVNHGFLNGKDLHRVLSESKVFIGLGFPFEGPAPLEAISYGTVFINPKFEPAVLFKGKPTARKVTSQNPYTEVFIGKPYVYTINISNPNEVRTAISEILHYNTFQPYLPYEYTEEGMIQRMNAYIEHQNFCKLKQQLAKWPPPEAVKSILGQPGKSCKDLCWENNLICEPSYFMELNSKEEIEKHKVHCLGTTYSGDIFYPAYKLNNQECTLQGDEMLFSCVGGHADLSRLCPCRSFIQEQTALCRGCES